MNSFFSFLTKWLSPSICGCLFLVSIMASGQIRYVKTNGSNATPATATSWATATPDLQGAINSLTATGGQVWVAQGTYKPTATTDRTISFRLPSNVSIYGGFIGTESVVSQRPVINLTSPSSTTLSGDIGLSGVTTDNSYHVLYYSGTGGSTFTLDGFVITGGNANGTSSPNNEGGGLFYGLPNAGTIVNCRFVANSASLGGGLYLESTSSGPTITNCSFSSNSATTGGGLAATLNANPALTNCSFSGNVAQQSGGGLYRENSTVSLTNCSFMANRAIRGGGMSSVNANGGLLDNCSFSTNSANQGGGLYNINGSPAIRYTSFTSNTATQGGGIYNSSASPVLLNTSFVTNNASDAGGGMYNTGSSTVDLRGCTFTGNSAESGGGIANNSSNPSLSGCTFTNNAVTAFGGGIVNYTSSPTVESSEFTGNVAQIFGGGIHNSNSNPVVRGTTFSANKADTGGGLSNSLSTPILTDCTFSSNTALTGGGGVANAESSPTINNCVFTTNTSLRQGGAMINTSNANPVLTNCNFLANKALLTGGGLMNTSSSPVLTFCLFTSNTATTSGGAIYNLLSANPNLINSRFTSNSATSGGAIGNFSSSPRFTSCGFEQNTATDGGVFYNTNTSATTVTNCSFRNNTATVGAGIYSVSSSSTLDNTIVWNSGGSNTFYTSSASVIANYCLFESAVSGYTGSNNLISTSSPFGSVGWQLSSCSAAINAGNPSSTTSTSGPYGVLSLYPRDLVNNPRIYGGRVDIGAYEYQGVAESCLFVRYVKQTASGTGDGTSWANASPNLQTMINSVAATENGGEVWVATGIYKPTTTSNRSIGFQMKNKVAIYGGFAGNETTRNQRPAISLTTPSSSTLSGDIGTEGITTDNSYHVIHNQFGLALNSTAILDGFIIKDGNSSNRGGGMLNETSSPSVSNCSFVGNMAATSGGAIANMDASNPSLVNCLFSANWANFGGGALYNSSSSPLLVNCSFSANITPENGGGVYEGTGSNSVLVNCSFSDNVASSGGDALFVFDANLTLTNCIVWGNGNPSTVNAISSTLTANYSLFDASVSGYIGSNNLTTSTSPFSNSTSLQLTSSSSAINSGSPTSITAASGPYTATTLPPTDLAGNVRIVGGRIDMGAIEYQGSVVVCSSMYTMQSGNWNDTSLWSCGRVPLITDVVTLHHGVSLPPTYQGEALRVIYTATGRLLFGVSSRLRLGGN